MERIVCKSCGGALVKAGETTYRCTHCGTIHELGADDSLAVRALIERNNERWVHINRRMDEFWFAVNHAADYDTKRVRFMSWLLGTALFGVAWFVVFALATATMPADFPQKVEFSASFGILPFLLVALLVTGVLGLSFLSLRNAMLRKARATIADVLEVYRAMSDKPVKDLLQSLHNPRRLTTNGAPGIALMIYDEAMLASHTPPPAQPQPRVA